MYRLLIIFFFISIHPAYGETKHISINDVSLEYSDTGKGEYTLVIESGVGTGVSYWQPFIEVASKLNVRVIAYSRACNGTSTSSKQISLEATAVRLNSLLNSIGADKNLILVGHSFGAFHSRYFANKYKNKVAGIVLIDPSSELLQYELEKLDAKKAKQDNVRINGMLQNQPEWQLLQDIYSKRTILASSVTQKILTVVVTSSQLNESDWWIGHSEAGKRIWRKLHHQLIDNNPTSAHIITNQTGHNIPIETPSLTLRAVQILLTMIESV